MTDERLAEIQVRADAATPGPWKCADPMEKDKMEVTDSVGQVCTTDLYGFEYPECWSNGEFIAAARQDIPDLLAELKAAEARMAKLDDGDMDCNACPLQAQEACDEICATKKSLADFGANMLARAEKAERERDVLARKFDEVSDKMNGHNPPRSICHACDICPDGSDMEMEGVTCNVRLCDWAAQEAAKGEACPK